ncbi:serine hydrolase domain-containing protein [Streptomyces nogalater]
MVRLGRRCCAGRSWSRSGCTGRVRDRRLRTRAAGRCTRGPTRCCPSRWRTWAGWRRYQLWSTTGDLARFAAFLARGDDRVLSARSVAEMRTPAAPAESADVMDGITYGLGLQIRHQDGRLLVGHSGSLPGFLANLTISVADDVAAVVLTNCTSGPLPGAVAADLVRIVAEAEPRIPEPWRPLREVDPAVLELVGQWYWGTHAFGLRATADGLLSLAPLTGEAAGPASARTGTAPGPGWRATTPVNCCGRCGARTGP